jgi:hypothetical protein
VRQGRAGLEGPPVALLGVVLLEPGTAGWLDEGEARALKP